MDDCRHDGGFDLYPANAPLDKKRLCCSKCFAPWPPKHPLPEGNQVIELIPTPEWSPPEVPEVLEEEDWDAH